MMCSLQVHQMLLGNQMGPAQNEKHILIMNIKILLRRYLTFLTVHKQVENNTFQMIASRLLKHSTGHLPK